ncbi:MAG: InlB B-repeat-containing protein, partial [Oscillospiraceae bacterium]|nr:InlB B-repeat-containing protein [Oscillospiraceae bacterium]
TDGRVLSNRAYSVAITSNQTLLSKEIAPGEMDGVIDLVGATNTAGNDVTLNYEGAFLNGMSKQKAIRRVDFGDTDVNSVDFVTLDYRIGETSSTMLEELRPRWSGDGSWGEEEEEEEPPAPPLPDHVIINQVYGTLDNTGAVSHGFIELYNPTDAPISLSGHSLQLQTGTQGTPMSSWKALPLVAVIPARCSFLVRCEGFGGTVQKFTLNYYDVSWSVSVSNRAYSVALVTGTMPLTNVYLNAGDYARVVDLVGGINTPGTDPDPNFEGSDPVSISKQIAARRKNFMDTDNNFDDFERVNYGSMSPAQLPSVRPRCLADGPWGGEDMVSPLPDHVIINQAYAAVDVEGAVSHGFVELYNPTDDAIDLSFYSLQYAAGTDDWSGLLPLTGYTIGARESFLIRGAGFGGAPRYTIPEDQVDIDWGLPFNNRNFTFALVIGTTPLANAVLDPDDWDRVIDLLGAVNDPKEGNAVNNWEGSGNLVGISKQKPCRRVKFADYDDNPHDFEILDYRASGISNSMLQEVRPRWSGDGPWGLDIYPDKWVKEEDILAFSRPGGRYGEPFELTLSTVFEGGVIRYTTDGSDPNGSSSVFSFPLQIVNRSSQGNYVSTLPSNPRRNPSGLVTKGTVIKARVFDAAGSPLTDIVTHSYFISLPTAYQNFPIVSLATSNTLMFNSPGLYNYNLNGKTEIPVHMDLIEPDNSGISQYMGIRLHGGATRDRSQKAFRLYAKTEYDPGKSRLEYDVLQGRNLSTDGSAITSYKRFLLRSGGNDKDSGATQPTMMRDAILNSFAEGLHCGYMPFRSSAVFLNGEFWGIYNIRSRLDEYHVQDLYKLKDRAKIGMFTFNYTDERPEEILENPVPLEVQDDWAKYQEMYNWFGTANLTDSANYEKAQTYLDIDNFIDYYAFQLFIGNDDWPANNMVMWRYRTLSYPTEELQAGVYDDGRWRYELKDLDLAFDGQFSTLNNGIDRILYRQNSSGVRINSPSSRFFRRLMLNPDFVKRFSSRMCDMMNFQLSDNVMQAKINEAQATLQPLMQEHINRWGNISNVSSWNNGFSYLRTIASGRRSNMLSQLKTQIGNGLNQPTEVNLNLKTDPSKGYLNINGYDILTTTWNVHDPSDWNGTYFPNYPQTITAVPEPGYELLHFLVNGTPHASNPLSLPLAAGTGTTIVAVYQESDCAVTWNTDGGTPAPTQTSVAYGGQIDAPEGMNKDDHIFGGWFDNEELAGEAVDFPITDVTEDRTFWAKWTLSSYTVTWNAGGGAPAPAQTSVVHGGQIDDPAEMSREGHAFGGWFDNEELNGDPVSFPLENITGNETFWAKWTLNSYALTWHTGGGAPAPTQTSVAYGGQIDAPDEMEKEGHTFGGWFDNEELSGDPVSFPLASVTIPAHCSYLIRCNGFGGTIPSFQLDYYDTQWNVPISNRAYSVALVKGAEPLANVYLDAADKARVVDLIGGINTPGRDPDPNYEGSGPLSISKQVSARRKNFADTDDNLADLERVLYQNILSAALADVRPRHLADGPWGVDETTADHLIINQVYGSGPLDNSGSISHSFVELYNPTDAPISLAGCALQVQNGKDTNNEATEWEKYDFAGGDVVAPHSSFLIRFALAAHSARYMIPEADLDWTDGRILSNRAYSVAITSNQTLLSKEIAPGEMDGVIDLVGATNTAGNDVTLNYETEPLNGMSKQKAIRRADFKDTDVNSVDFATLDYRIDELNNTMLEELRPRWSGDGSWGMEEPETPAVDHVIINQVYGTLDNSGAVSHGFIELYNPTDAPISLSGHSIQLQMGVQDTPLSPWNDVLPLTGVTGDKTFWAKWTLNSYTVTWNADGGEPVPAQTSVSHGGQIDAPDEMDKEGYIFDGWFDNEELIGEALTFPLENVTGGVTFWAKWTLNSYTVTWNADGGEPVPAQTGVSHGGQIDAPDEMDKEGYIFDGWFDNEELIGEALTFPLENVTGSVTFWAKWTQLEPEILDIHPDIIVDDYNDYIYGFKDKLRIEDIIGEDGATDGVYLQVKGNGRFVADSPGEYVGTGYVINFVDYVNDTVTPYTMVL